MQDLKELWPAYQRRHPGYLCRFAGPPCCGLHPPPRFRPFPCWPPPLPCCPCCCCSCCWLPLSPGTTLVPDRMKPPVPEAVMCGCVRDGRTCTQFEGMQTCLRAHTHGRAGLARAWLWCVWNQRNLQVECMHMTLWCVEPTRPSGQMHAHNLQPGNKNRPQVPLPSPLGYHHTRPPPPWATFDQRRSACAGGYLFNMQALLHMQT